MENITFECPSCGQVLETPADVAGQVVQCPSCDTTFEVPAPVIDEPESETAPEAAQPEDDLMSKLAGSSIQPPPTQESEPADDPLLSKLAGSAQKSSDDAPIGGWSQPAPPPSSDEVDEDEVEEEEDDEPQETEAAPPSISPKPKIGLQVRKEEPKDEQEVIPGTEEGGLFQQPVYTGPSWHLPRWSKLVISSVLSLLFLFVTMCFIQFGDSREIKLWINGAEAIENPKSKSSLKDLKDAITGIKETGNNKKEKVGLMASYGLGLIMAGDVQDGSIVCKYISRKYKGQTFADMVSEKKIMRKCRECQNHRPETCRVCDGKKDCLSCEGAGFKRRGVLSGSSGGLGNGFRRVIGRARNAGGGNAAEAGADEAEQKCVSCDGTGKCPNCKGIGREPFFCTHCKGTEQEIAMNKINAQQTAIAEQLGKILKKRNNFGKLNLAMQALKFNIGSEPSLTTDGIDAAQAAMLFSKSEKTSAEEEEYLEHQKTFVYDDTSLSVADALIALSLLRSSRLAIDPEVFQLIEGKDVKVEEMKDLNSPEFLQKFLSDNGLVAKSSPLTEKTKVTLVTTESSFAYSLAVLNMVNGNYVRAYSALENVDVGQTETIFDDSCKKLKNLLVMMGKDNRELKKLAKEAEECSSRIRRAMNAEKKNAAMKNGSGIVVGLVEYMRNVAGTRITIAKRFKEACEAGMTSEARALLQYLITERKLIIQAADSLKAQRVKTSSIVVPKLPASVTQLFATIDGVYNKAQQLFTECEENELYTSDVPKVARNMAAAYYLDRASIKAKVGMGYATIANHHHLFVKPEKLSLKMPEASTGVKVVSEGASMGLGGKGAVKLGVGAYNTVSGLGVDKQYAYWTLLPFHDLTAKVELPEVGISRTSVKNPLNIISARQSYKWLLVDHETKVKSKGLLMSLKSGSGEGATDCFALPVSMAALSLYDKKKYRDDVLCAGGIEPDGTLLRIRGTTAKVRAVVDSGKLKMMVVPAANKADLAILSVDDLCKCIIVLAEDVNEAMGCATKMDYKEDVLAALVEAQNLIMGGSLYEAKKKLITIGNHSQVYNIGRLLELLTIADL